MCTHYDYDSHESKKMALLAVVTIILVVSILFAGCTRQSTSAEDATRIALNNTNVKNLINAGSFEVHQPSRETVSAGDKSSQEVWNVQIWMKDHPFIIIVEVADDGSIWDIREGHNPNVMQMTHGNISEAANVTKTTEG